MSKQTIGEQAEQQANAFNKSALSKVEKPPTKLGSEYCVSCDIKIPMARREAYGNDLCVWCAERREKLNRRRL